MCTQSDFVPQVLSEHHRTVGAIFKAKVDEEGTLMLPALLQSVIL
jgi:hypothetical protein